MPKFKQTLQYKMHVDSKSNHRNNIKPSDSSTLVPQQ